MVNSVLLRWVVIGIGWDSIQFTGLTHTLQGIWHSWVPPTKCQKYTLIIVTTIPASYTSPNASFLERIQSKTFPL